MGWQSLLLGSKMDDNDLRHYLHTDVPEHKELDDDMPHAEDMWYEGFNMGYLSGYDAGISLGRVQGYEDCLYRIKRMAENIFDPELEKAIKILTGEE